MTPPSECQERYSDDGFSKSSIRKTLDELTDGELAEFHNAINAEGGCVRDHCFNRPWFNKIQSFFNTSRDLTGRTISIFIRVVVEREAIVRLRIK